METIIIPPEFVILFFIPIIGFFYIANKTLKFWPPFTFYIVTQILLATFARYMFG